MIKSRIKKKLVIRLLNAVDSRSPRRYESKGFPRDSLIQPLVARDLHAPDVSEFRMDYFITLIKLNLCQRRAHRKFRGR